MKHSRYFASLIITLGLLFISTSVTAQQRSLDILGIEYGQSLDSGDGSDFTDMSIYGLAPIVTEKDRALISFPYFNYKSINHSDLALPSSKFYQIGLPLAMQTPISSSKNLGAFIIPNISSDLANPDGKNFNIAAALFLGNNTNSKFIFRYGIYYSYSTNGHILIPIFNYDWKPTENFRINGNNPLNPKISYQLAPRYRVGLEFEYYTKLYNLSKSNHDRYVADTRTTLNPYIDINITKNIVLNIQGGYAFQRKTEVFKGVNRGTSWYTGFKDRTPVMSQNQKGWFLKGGLRFEITPSLD